MSKDFEDYSQIPPEDFGGDSQIGPENSVDTESERAASIPIKVSDDRGITWSRATLDMSVPIGDSGLRAGQLLVMNGEKYEVCADDWGDIGLRPVRPARAAKTSKPTNKKPGKPFKWRK